jgi:hypothetical protein
MPDKKKVYVIVLNWNNAKDTIKCLKALKKDDYPNYKVLLVDNASTDDSVKKIKKIFPNYEFILNKKNYGFAKGFNIGLKEGIKRGAAYVVALNNDVFVEKNFLAPLVSLAETDPKIGLAGPKVLDTQGKINSIGVEVNLDKGVFPGIGSGEKDHGQFNKVKEVKAIGGCCLFIKSDLMKKIGGIPEDYFFYYEETDFCMKTRKAGFKIFVEPNSVVRHRIGGSSNPEEGTFSKYYMIRNRLIFMHKYAPRASWVKFIVRVTCKNTYYVLKFFLISLFKKEGKRERNWSRAHFWGYLDFLRSKKGRAEYNWLTNK